VFVNHVANVETLRGLFVYDAAGRWLVHSEPTSDATRNNADREYFEFHRSNLSRSTRISAPIISRSSREWVIPVSRRVSDPDGNFAGVALATLSVQRLRNLLDKYEVGQDGAIALGLPDQMLFRKPFNVEDVGRPTSPSPLHSVFNSKASGTVVGLSSIDGVERLISFESMKNYPIRTTVAVSKQEALRAWRKASYVQGTWTLILCCFVGFSGRYIIRAMRLRIAAEAGLRQTRDELAAANDKLSELAQFDSLTGLANRRYFDIRLTRMFGRAQRERNYLAVVLIDVDQFKNYNDLYGHVQGDDCLRQVASAVQSVARRPGALVARYGGEELVILVPEANIESATALAEAARAAVLALEITHAAAVLGQVSISLGVAAWVPGPDEAPYALVRSADSALYRAKRSGRNQVA
jgi:diguanylate cyclase (GGDEF)-like protein